MKSFTKLALVCASAFLFFSISNLQAQTRLYVPGQTIDDTQNNVDDGVGINVPEPEARLHVFEGTEDATGLLLFIEGSSLGKFGGGPAWPKFALRVDREDTDALTGPKTVFSIMGNGEVNAGTTTLNTPDRLSVYRDFGVYFDAQDFFRIDLNSAGPKLEWHGTNLIFHNVNNNETPLTLTPNGKVGINTDHFVGNHSLYVEGSAIAEEIYVKLKADWADYVFAPDYKLMSLKELEAYINRNQRLPGMKSAEEIAEEGVAIGETERKLTEKVEELTLYIIEMNKKIEALEAKLVEAEKEK